MGGGLGQPGVAGGDRFGDGCVLGGCGCEPLRIVGCQAAHAHQVHAQAAHGLCQVGVGDGGIDGGVEAPGKIVVGVPAGVAAVNKGRSFEELLVELEENAGITAFGCQRCGFAFEGFAKLEEFVDVIERNVGDDDTAAAGRRRQPFGGKPAQRLPQWSS
ncbi:hypothetical protein A6A22_08515 [Arthrobacter sp. OY3WO11]|nr:hypothetical protein A6A22_08515 [Arthrobacter sp. OY3WO11]